MSEGEQISESTSTNEYFSEFIHHKENKKSTYARKSALRQIIETCEGKSYK